ncbi:thiamine pyrophosphate-binding protein [Pseudomonas sp. C27(2019)]|uniref:thiamine pyrophosphate-binding protein n=1 Tax=Pseudomonas sp. C27(2019) TaxID=2604941 RepID=UPI001244D13A|nr:thiamine pyrophosphate-binding protein [Pseudomonas sp. C27(2019)]QEY58077.1 thiamine pyrophosphate-binding protein [Pseudomonas sp. C27(2019)]
MKKTGAALARFALEQLGVRYTFGIPGVHNTELYDELNSSEQIQPVLVTHECGGAFMADAISRTGDSIGTLLIVPAAGVTHASSGIGEAYLAGIPMLVISGGIHTESGHRYQLHEMDQHRLLSPITKGSFHIKSHSEVIPALYAAYQLAMHGEPGPVFVELPYNIGNFLGEVDTMPSFAGLQPQTTFDHVLVKQAAELLTQAKQVGFFLGWGAVDCQAELIELAQLLNAPVATTLQGLSAFPGNHPLHTGMGFGGYSVPAGQKAFAQCDAVLAIGTRFAEIPTGSFSMQVPEDLVHIDINPQVFSANYPAKVAIEGDARAIVPALLSEVRALQRQAQEGAMAQQIKQDKAAYQQQWLAHKSGDRVNPAQFFQALRAQLSDDCIVVADDGNHTYLVAELLPILGARNYISPTDFNAMGYCVPAVIGAKFANPQRAVIGIVGDGALLMTGMEMLTAVRHKLGVVVFIFNDGELSQIAQAQQIPYNRKTCTVLHGINMQALAATVGAQFVSIQSEADIETGIRQALQFAANNQPVYVDVNIDYSKRTRFTQGIVKATLKRFKPRDKVRVISRALIRKVTG